MSFFPEPWTIVGGLLEGLCAAFFYVFGENERSAGWKWALLSIGIWVFICLLLGWGLIFQLLAQIGLFASITWYGMTHPPETRITR